MLKVPCEFSDWKDKNGVKVGFKVTVYYVLCECEGSVPFELHSFTSQSDALDNVLLARECGVFAELHYCYIYVCPTFYPLIYNLIEEYVSASNNDKE